MLKFSNINYILSACVAFGRRTRLLPNAHIFLDLMQVYHFVPRFKNGFLALCSHKEAVNAAFIQEVAIGNRY